MDHLNRKDLKTDQVAESAFTAMDWASHHRATVTRWAGVVVALAVVALGIYYYRDYQAGLRQADLAKALRVDEATTGADVQAALQHFATPEEKTAAWTKAFGEVATKHPGTAEGATAEVYLAGSAAEKGDMAQAEKRFKNVVENAPDNYAALARISLAEIYSGQGKTSEAEKLLRDAVAHPTITVSKEQATLALGQLLAKTNPTEARKLITPLMSSRTVISRTAVTTMGSLPAEPEAAPAPKSGK